MKVLLFNGLPALEDAQASIHDILLDEFHNRQWEVRESILREEKIAYCSGCFGCWIKTPGVCVINDAGRDIAKAIMQSDLVVYLTPVTFGGYSSVLKKALDRMVPILSPFFIKIDGETHHEKRYDRYPSMIAVGILTEPDEESAKLFETLHSRNAINAHAPVSAATAVASSSGPEEARMKIGSLLQKIGAAQ